ncbi:Vanillate O-demethylase oxygenase subunit [Cupriavidus basilensis]|uniref:Vanillate O-demethylase oxygenase subunit n=2 Tax=Cupriavidus basilensis TaxID=68895 RepID=A0A0C4YK14_9BURK|nr:Vanillate O-demethylase oxygenase subunit [Cupriavidus basilensis]
MFPLNSWYVAGWDHEIGRKLLAKMICGIKVVLYRKTDGSVAALEDACWHRQLPLSLGTLEGDTVTCGYHGLSFNGDGRCTHMPSQETINPSACVRSFPIVEQHRFVWIWMGEAHLADPSKIPDFHQNENPEWAGDGGTTHLECDYRLLVDNLMDLTHETFVHSSSIGNRAVAEAPFTVSRTEESVIVTRWMIGIDPPPFFKKQLGGECLVDRWQIITFRAPSAVTIDVGVARTGTGAPQGDRSKGVTGFVIHVSTPETERSCHYYWAFLRNYQLSSQKLTTEWRESARSILAEDKTILEAQQKAVDFYGDRDFNPLSIDSGVILARRRIEEMVATERQNVNGYAKPIIPIVAAPTQIGEMAK